MKDELKTKDAGHRERMPRHTIYYLRERLSNDSLPPTGVYVVDRGNHRINVFKADGAFLFSFGEAQLAKPSEPTWVAVDNDNASPSHHDVYVTTDSLEVEKFKASGEFITSFGGKGEAGNTNGCLSGSEPWTAKS